MKHTILFPTDFSAASEKVFGHAVRLANKLDADLHVLHVYHYQMPSLDVVPNEIRNAINVEAEGDAQKHMDHYAEVLRAQTGHEVSLSTMFKTGFATDEIPMIAAEIGATIIVMGATGASGKINEVVGTVTSSVIERAPCPVLAVPPERAEQEVWKMTYASSFRENEIEYFSKVEKIGRDMGMRIAVVHVAREEQAAAFDENNQFFSQKKRDGELDYYVLNHNVPADGLKAYLKDHPVDILALHPRKRTFWQNLFQESTTKKILLSHKVNVMAITDDAAERMYS
ncbi:MAG: universal stress protein [Bacteroidia bacterium]